VKKLLHIQLLPILSGVQNFSLHLLDGLPEGEYEISLAAKPGGALEQEVTRRGWWFIPIKALRHPISPWDAVAFWQILRVLKQGRFDIVHTNSSKPGLLGRIAATVAGVPLVLHTCHGTPFQRNQHIIRFVLFAALDWLGNRFCHRVTFVNHSDRIHCVKMGLLPEAKATTIYNAIPDKLASLLDDIADNRRAKGMDEEFVIGSTLRFTTQKNVVETVVAACQACERDRTLRFVLLGDGEHLQLCRLIVGSHGLSERVLLPGWDADITAWLPRFDAFLLYSLWESQPFSLIEAMRSGLPVVASNIPALCELVDDTCGWLVNLHEPSALADCIIDVSRQRKHVRSMGIHAKERITELCNHQRMVDAYQAIYRSANA